MRRRLAAALREEAYEEKFSLGSPAAASAASMALGPGWARREFVAARKSVTKR